MKPRNLNRLVAADCGGSVSTAIRRPRSPGGARHSRPTRGAPAIWIASWIGAPIPLGFLILLLALVGAGCSHEPTALELIREGNRYVGEPVKNRVVQLRSEKSVGSLVPNIWYVVYYDPDATFKATEVKFGAGQKLDVTRPIRVLELGTGDYKELDRTKLNTDSNRAISIATSQPALKDLKLTATKMTLARGDAGPEWKVTIWASRLRNPNEDADVGSIFIDSATGKVVRSDLHINRVD